MVTQQLLSTANVIRCRDREEWQRKRQLGIGSSDASSIWGVNKWQSAYACAWSKLGELEADEPSIMMGVGHALEPFIAELFTQATGIELVDPGDFTIYQHAELPFMLCTPDRLTLAGEIVELKTASFASAGEWKERIPSAYQVQLAHQMCVLDCDVAHIAVLINSSDFRHHTLRRNPRFEKQHIAKCTDFWKGYVEKGEFPPPDYSESCGAAIAARYPVADDSVIDLPAELDSLGESYDIACMEENAAKKRKSEIQNVVKDVLGDASMGRLGDGTGFSWKGSPRRFRRIDKEITVG